MTNRQEWLKKRKTYIGGSDIGAIVGSNYKTTPLDVYLDKVSEGECIDDMNEPAYWGIQLESVVAEEYSRRTGLEVKKPEEVIYHSEYPHIAANLDGWVNGESHILECKTASFTKAHEWGEAGTDQIPESYLYQVAYYCAITGATRADIAVLIGGNDFRIYQYLKIPEMETKLIKAANIFWNKYIVSKTPPEPRSEADTAKLFPKASGREAIADDTILQKIDMLCDLKSKNSIINQQVESLQVDVKNYMQDADLLMDDSGVIKAVWKNRKGAKRLDTKLLKAEHNEIYQEYLKQGEGTRVFALK
jgi:putative phage-type endonuclease